MDIQKAFGFEQKEIEVNGQKYLLQNMPFQLFYQMQERCKDKNGNAIPSKMYDEIFKNVIISPKVTWDNFTKIEDIEDLMAATFQFLSGEKPVDKGTQE